MKILFIANSKFPYPVQTGSRMRTWLLLNSLFDGNQVDLLCVGGDLNTCVSGKFNKIWSYNKKSKIQSKSILKRFINLIFCMPWEVSTTYSMEFEKYLLEIIEANDYDLIFARYLSAGKYLINLMGALTAKLIIDLDDLEFLKNRRQIRFEKERLSYSYFREILNNLIFERYYKKLQKADSLLVCSDCDKKYLNKNLGLNNVGIVPNAIESKYYENVQSLTDFSMTEKTILICGTLSYKPNEDAILWFVDKVLPAIKKRMSGVKVIIVGFNPNKPISDLAFRGDVEVYANVESVLPFYEKCSLVVVPIKVGGGTRIKILEAFACRRPVVTTSVGAEGLGVVNNEHCVLADDPNEFAEACVRILVNSDLSVKLSYAGYKYVEKHFSTKVVEQLLKDIIKCIHAEKEAKSADDMEYCEVR